MDIVLDSMKPSKEPLELLIPEGMYCYNTTNRVKIQNKVIDSDGNRVSAPYYFAPENIVCPFWKPMDNGDVYCSHMDETSEREDFMNLVWDQVKECNINPGEHMNLFELEEQRNADPNWIKAGKRATKYPQFIESVLNLLLDSEVNELIYDGVAYTLSQDIIDELN